MTTLLAIDLGTQTGWARGRMAEKPQSGTQSFALGRFDGGGMRYLRFQVWLEEMLRGVDRVAYEEVRRHTATDAAHVYGGLMGCLTATCEQQEIPYEGVPVGTIKKWATGKGNAGKPAMVQAVLDRGFRVKDDNEADAIALWLYRAEAA